MLLRIAMKINKLIFVHLFGKNFMLNMIIFLLLGYFNDMIF